MTTQKTQLHQLNPYIFTYYVDCLFYQLCHLYVDMWKSYLHKDGACIIYKYIFQFLIDSHFYSCFICTIYGNNSFLWSQNNSFIKKWRNLFTHIKTSKIFIFPSYSSKIKMFITLSIILGTGSCTTI